MKTPVKGWFKLLSQQEGEFYNVPIMEEGEEMEALTKELEVQVCNQIVCFSISLSIIHTFSK